jgi:hypothetical protein
MVKRKKHGFLFNLYYGTLREDDWLYLDAIEKLKEIPFESWKYSIPSTTPQGYHQTYNFEAQDDKDIIYILQRDASYHPLFTEIYYWHIPKIQVIFHNADGGQCLLVVNREDHPDMNQGLEYLRILTNKLFQILVSNKGLDAWSVQLAKQIAEEKREKELREKLRQALS